MASTYTGLALPTGRTLGGYFAAQPTKVRALSDAIITLFTPIGSRPFRRTFGSGLLSLPFARYNSGAASIIIQGAVAAWCPYVNIQQVLFSPPSLKTSTVKISYSVPNTV